MFAGGNAFTAAIAATLADCDGVHLYGKIVARTGGAMESFAPGRTITLYLTTRPSRLDGKKTSFAPEAIRISRPRP